MSMLTPPGMSGKKYRVTGERYPRMRRPRRRRKAMITLTALVALGGLGFGGLQLAETYGLISTEPDEPQAAASPDPACEAPADPEPVALPVPETITVNVFNATERVGLARETADALAERGFVIGVVDNAPEELDGSVATAGLLLGSAAAEETGALAVLGTHAAGLQTRAAERDSTEVDLVLGDAFEALAEPETAEAALTALAAPAEPDCAEEPAADGTDEG